MSKSESKIQTPISALEAMNQCFDQALQQLDIASEHFALAVLPAEDYLSPDGIPEGEDKDHVMFLIENYALQSGFLLDHPLLAVIRQIREESSVSDDQPSVMAIEHRLRVDQIFTHYKGSRYRITAISKDANSPLVEYISYQDLDPTKPQVWTLPLYEFTKSVMWENERVSRFTFTGTYYQA